MELAATRRKGHSPRSADPSWAAIPSGGEPGSISKKHASDAFNAHNRGRAWRFSSPHGCINRAPGAECLFCGQFSCAATDATLCIHTIHTKITFFLFILFQRCATYHLTPCLLD